MSHNIYFLGRSGFINYRGHIIGGISGIFSNRFFNTAAKVDHFYRKFDIEKLFCESVSLDAIDIFVSHDWPQNIIFYGNKKELLRVKPFLRSELSNGTFGSPPLFEVMHRLKPKYWFSAHMHVFFKAHYGPTEFTALNKNSHHGGWISVLP